MVVLSGGGGGGGDLEWARSRDVVGSRRRGSTTPEVVERHGQDAVDSRGQELIGFHRELTASVFRGKGSAGVAAALRERTGYEVLVADAGGGILAATCVECAVLEPLPPGLVVERRGWMAGELAMRYGDRWVAVVGTDGEMLGTISLWDPDGSAEESHLVALGQAAMVLALDLFRLRSVAEAEVAAWGDLATELLDGGDTSRARSHAQMLGYDVDRPHRVVLVQSAGAMGTDLHVKVRNELSGWGRGRLLATLRSDGVVLVIADGLDWLEPASWVASQCGPGVRIGVGGTHGPNAMRRSLDDARLALSLTAAAGNAGPVVVFDDLGIWRVLARSIDPSDLRVLVAESIGALVDYDAKHGSELVKTLTVFFSKTCEMEAAAAALFIHRNTLKYRLGRIAQITGNDLGDPDDRFSLDLACRAWITVQALGSTAVAR
jgi:hypothetical protein